MIDQASAVMQEMYENLGVDLRDPVQRHAVRVTVDFINCRRDDWWLMLGTIANAVK